MNDEPLLSAEEAEAVDAVRAALRRAGRLLPYLMGLARLVRIAPDARIASAGIFASGRLVVNPTWFLALKSADRIFVAAHQLLHLALRSHDRCIGVGGRIANTAEDYVINDMLRGALHLDIPTGGLDCPGVACYPAERLAEALRERFAEGEALVEDAWSEPRVGDDHPETAPIDVLDALTERRWFSDEDMAARSAAAAAVAEAAGQAVELGVLRERLDGEIGRVAAATDGMETMLRRALDARYPASWKWALQGWLEAAAPSRHSFRHRSRHQGEGLDIVFPGYRTGGWTLDVVLDAPGSAEAFLDVLQEVGMVAQIEAVRLWRCGKGGISSETVAIDALSQFRGRGAGTGDPWPVLDCLAGDPAAVAALVLTEADEDRAAASQPYPVLWAYAGDAPA